MRFMISAITFFGLILALGCGDSTSPFQSFVGEWKSDRAGGTYYESWTKVNDNQYAGKSCMIQNQDTISQESFGLFKLNEGWTLTVSGSGFDPVDFPVTHFEEGAFTAENQENDFPKMISYQKTGAGLHAFITNGGQDTIHFDFTPLK